MSLERVQKILAQSGIASRRKAEELIAEGSVTINGQVARLGDKADLSKDAIKVNGKLLQGKEPETYIAFHKPKGVISMLADPEGRPTLADYLKHVKTRVFPIGRLDFMSEGLLLLTNDGDFAEKLQRRDDITRMYHVKVKGHPNEEMLERLRRGARIGNRLVQPKSVRISDEYSNKARIEVVIVGSGAVDLRAFIEARGFLVERITRAAIGHITLSGLIPGAMKILEKSQVEALLKQPELGTRMVERLQVKKPRFKATSEEDREKARARFRGEAPRLDRIRQKQEDYRSKVSGRPAKTENSKEPVRSERSFEKRSSPRTSVARGAPSTAARGARGTGERGYGVFRDKERSSSMRVKFKGEGRNSERDFGERSYGRSDRRGDSRGDSRSRDSSRDSRGGRPARRSDAAPARGGFSRDRGPEKSSPRGGARSGGSRIGGSRDGARSGFRSGPRRTPRRED